MMSKFFAIMQVLLSPKYKPEQIQAQKNLAQAQTSSDCFSLYKLFVKWTFLKGRFKN